MPTPEGLPLLSQSHAPHGVRLLNPLTGQLTDLPPFATLLTPEQLNDRQGDKEFLVRGVAVADDSTVAICLTFHRGLAIAKPGDERWTSVSFDHRLRLYSTLSFAGRIYCASAEGTMTLEISSDQPLRLLMAAKMATTPHYFMAMTDSLHLVDNGGELLLRHRMIRADGGHKLKRRCAASLTPVESLSGRAVFVGSSRSVSLPASMCSSSIRGDTVYVGFDCDEKGKIDGYHVGDGTTQPSRLTKHTWRFRPWTLADCLSWCI
uniref:KIB1-4 beta-propeller domain-containing protein n=1 Tax=Oryza brachyantha TaxID=4533 RepID=J3MMA0_ORYBR